MEVNFTKKVVLVTGASAGIGEATAILFAKLGASLSLVGRNEQNLKKVADQCEKESGLKPLAIIADLGTDAGVEKTAKETIEHFGRLDVLVNNVGVGARATILKTDMAAFDQVFNTDVRGVYNLTRLLAPELIKTKGNIVNISSIAATAVVVGSLPYSMAKAALDQFTKLISLELAPHGVRVNTVSPGITVSDFIKRMINFTDQQYQDYLKSYSQIIPMGDPCLGHDIAQMIAHLASDNSRLVTGTIVEVDGGLRFTLSGNVSSHLKLDVLVNNVGVGGRGAILEADMATFDEIFNTDVRGVYNLTRLLAPHLVKTKGNIVNVSSTVATVVYIGSLPYSMAKAAQDQFTKLKSLELAPHGVRVNTVSPGLTVSNFVKRLTNSTEEEYQEYLKKHSSTIPMGEPCLGLDIAQMIVHLASDNSRLATGTIVDIDGGLRFTMSGTSIADRLKAKR